MNNIVLYHPEIPQNLGNIMRTCSATGSILHIIKPIAFSLSDKEIKRSSVNYAHNFTYYIYESFDEFFKKNKGEYFFLTRYGKVAPSQADFSSTDKNLFFIFGAESTGLPYELLKDHFSSCFRLPMKENVRALNLSNCVAITIYEALRQQNYFGLSLTEPESLKGEDFIPNYENN